MPDDPEGIQDVLRWLLKEKFDVPVLFTPLVSNGWNSMPTLLRMTDEDISKVVPIRLRKKFKSVLAATIKANKKRTHDDSHSTTDGAKKGRSLVCIAPPDVSDEPNVSVVNINRSPVMILWGAVVAERMHLPWTRALSMASAVASFFARSKGVSLGIYQQRKATDRMYSEDSCLLGHQLRMEPCVDVDGGSLAIDVEGVPVRPESVDAYLHRAFPQNTIGHVYRVMNRLAKALPLERLRESNGRLAYDIYCQFRPSIPSGRAGWGAKGELTLAKLHDLSAHWAGVAASSGANTSTSSTTTTAQSPRNSTCARESDVADAITPTKATAPSLRQAEQAVWALFKETSADDGLSCADVVSRTHLDQNSVDEALQRLSADFLVYQAGDVFRRL
eukprot:m.564910 g.564910  ORF g.564910 m.564910 type:complete len:389 (-) comp22238_c0_seq7:301-1467(-)